MTQSQPVFVKMSRHFTKTKIIFEKLIKTGIQWLQSNGLLCQLTQHELNLPSTIMLKETKHMVDMGSKERQQI